MVEKLRKGRKKIMKVGPDMRTLKSLRCFLTKLLPVIVLLLWQCCPILITKRYHTIEWDSGRNNNCEAKVLSSHGKLYQIIGNLLYIVTAPVVFTRMKPVN